MFAPPMRMASISCCSLCIVLRVAGVDIFSNGFAFVGSTVE
jgi:hypothetical protein